MPALAGGLAVVAMLVRRPSFGLLLEAVVGAAAVLVVRLGRRLARDESVTRGLSDVREASVVMAVPKTSLGELELELCLLRIVCTVGLIVCLYDSGGRRCVLFWGCFTAGGCTDGRLPTVVAILLRLLDNPDGRPIELVEVDGIADCLRGIVFRVC